MAEARTKVMVELVMTHEEAQALLPVCSSLAGPLFSIQQALVNAGVAVAVPAYEDIPF